MLVLANASHAQPERYVDVYASEWTPDQIARRNVSATTSREFEPRWADSPATWTPRNVHVIDGRAQIVGLETTPQVWTLDVHATEPSLLEATLLYFPGWTVSGPHGPIAVEAAEGTGLIRFRVSAGEQRLRLSFERTPPTRLGTALSIVTLVLGLGLLLGIGRTKRLQRRTRSAAGEI
jgi:hypothetical protein